MEITSYKKPRPQNAAGNLYVDESCIDCDVCRWMCPSVFGRKGIKSAVINQPHNEQEKIQAYAAMISCPVGSIRTNTPDPLVKHALDALPADIDAVNLPGIKHLGYHSVDSYGATPYLVVRPQGNIMIDSPRFNERLAIAVERLGGLKYIILTHKDDVADHVKWQNRFPKSQRIMHRADARGDTAKCELLLEGEGFWNPDADFEIIHTPGHTAGSICVLVRTRKDVALFTGDHLAYSETGNRLTGFKPYNHGNLLLQGVHIRMLAEDEYPFTWLLPGHGRMARFESLTHKKEMLTQAADDFESEDESEGMFAVGYS